MSKITNRKNGIALLMLMLLVGSATFTGFGKSLDTIFASEAHISEVALGHDKKISEPTDDFDSDDTIFAAVEIEENTKTVKVIGRLHIVEVAGQKAGPIPGIETSVTLTGDGVANFQFSKPTKGWPLGTYKFVALLVDGKGETIDTEEHEFTVE